MFLEKCTMAPNLQYATEEELSTGPTPQRLAVECGIVAALCFLALKFGGFHKGGNPLGEVVEINLVSALVISTVVTLLFLAARVWRMQGKRESSSDE
jgi:hypothetical protein